MDAKVMKEMLEGQSGLTAEYIKQDVSDNRTSLHFSQIPNFVNLSLRQVYSDTEYIGAVSLPYFFSSKEIRAYYPTDTSSNDFFVAQWDNKTLNLTSLNANYIYAIAFF